MKVAVIGKGRNCPAPVWDLAHEVGGLLALPGVLVLTGGLGGVMDGAAKGVHDAGGQSLGLCPNDGTSPPSPWNTWSIQTGLPAVIRNTVLIAAADMVVCLPGSDGTVQELGLAIDRDLAVFKVGHHGGFFTGRVPIGVEVRVEDLRDAIHEAESKLAQVT